MRKDITEAGTAVQISRVYEVSPLPHGTQRRDVTKLLADWGWAGKALQPGKSNQHYMVWRVGTNVDPPDSTMQAYGSDVVINPVKEPAATPDKPRPVTSLRTQQHMKQAHKANQGTTDVIFLVKSKTH